MRGEYYLAIARHSAPPVWEPVVEDVWGGEEARAPEVLGIFEHQEEVHVANQDPAQLHHSAACENERALYKLILMFHFGLLGLLVFSHKENRRLHITCQII